MANAPDHLVTLPAVLDLDAIEEVRDALLAALERGPVTVAAGGVERIATNALVMLLSAAETAERNGVAFRIAGLSAAARTAIDRLGFSASFSAMAKG
jgi:anti-anti-sigma regulatory factor